MRASFIHVADVHLGNEQYGMRARYNDFSQAFWEIISEALRLNVDFVVIAGDLFHKRAIDARTLIHAIDGLKRLRDRGIPVYAIEGNHDRSYFREGVSWLQFLCFEGYIVLLDPQMVDGAPVLVPWDRQSMRGAYVDLPGKGLRVYGLKWQGSATAQVMEGLTRALEAAEADEQQVKPAYRLLMMHTGIDGVVPRMTGLPTQAQFGPLKKYIDYLALGHVHKPFERDGWIFNPGSTETCGAEEAAWEDRGYYYVQVDTDAPEGQRHQATHLLSKRRPFVRHEVRVDTVQEPEALYELLAAYSRREGPRYAQEGTQPLVQIQLFGTLAFDVSALDFPRMEEIVAEHFRPLAVRIENNTNDRDYLPDTGELDGRDRSTWHELERQIFEDLIGRDARYLPARAAWGTVLAQLKEMALDRQDPAQIASFLRTRRQELLNEVSPTL